MHLIRAETDDCRLVAVNSGSVAVNSGSVAVNPGSNEIIVANNPGDHSIILKFPEPTNSTDNPTFEYEQVDEKTTKIYADGMLKIRNVSLTP